MTKLKVGIAGYGIVGKRREECINNHPDTNLVAVCDQSFKENKSLSNNVHHYKDYRDLIKHDIDVLLVSLPNEIAPKVTIAGLNRGLHTFCEKPPGKDVSDIESVIEIEKKNPDLKLMYGFNHRYHDSVKDALEIVKSGSLGSIINMKGVYGKSKLITFNQPGWRVKRDIAGGGVLLDQGIHMVDLMRLFAGDFEEVNSFVSNSHWKYDVEDNAYALMKSKSGVIGMIHSSATQWRHRFNLDINLDGGNIILGGILSGTKSYGSETLTIITADPESDRGDPKENMIKYNKDPSWHDEIKSFIDTIIHNKPILNGSSNDALETMKLVYRIYYEDIDWRKKFNIKNPQ
jgi:predicted dehydrogenase